jgi:hypothetical protein
LNTHGYKFSKAEQAKLRHIQVNFTVARTEEPRNNNSNRSRYDRQEFDRHIAVGGPPSNMFVQSATQQQVPESKKEEEPIKETPKEKKPHLDEELKQELANRNKKLIQTMKDILQDDAKFKGFRTTSGQFLTGAITESQYYKSFVSTFGPLKADELFSELIDLLPDETKRQKLLAAQRKIKDEVRKTILFIFNNKIRKKNFRNCPLSRQNLKIKRKRVLPRQVIRRQYGKRLLLPLRLLHRIPREV